MPKLLKPENIEYENLRGFEKAAILINYLGANALRVLFKSLEDGDVRKLLNVMQKYRVVPVHVTKKVLEEYYELVSETEDYIFSEKSSTKDTIVEALGEERARGILGGVNMGSGGGRNLESLEMVDAKSLSTFLVNEHPQTVAVILAHLEPEKKGEVLKRLPDALQAEVVLRMANLDHVAPELIAEIDAVLKRELASMSTVEQAPLAMVDQLPPKNSMSESIGYIQDRPAESFSPDPSMPGIMNTEQTMDAQAMPVGLPVSDWTAVSVTVLVQP